mmetsp:Transcript_114040/g.221501  ORF Transcript_114040/g.221501 Transcript_114040/m.221501 type:complete len:269 (-) Transcript_114040:53-859(-)
MLCSDTVCCSDAYETEEVVKELQEEQNDQEQSAADEATEFVMALQGSKKPKGDGGLQRSTASKMRALFAEGIDKSMKSWVQMKIICDMVHEEMCAPEDGSVQTDWEAAVNILHDQLQDCNRMPDTRAATILASLAALAFLDMVSPYDHPFGSWGALERAARAVVAAQQTSTARLVLAEWLEQAKSKTPFGTPTTREERWRAEQHAVQGVDDVEFVPTDPSYRLFPPNGKPPADGVPCWFESVLCVCELGDKHLEASVRKLLAGPREPR